LGDRGANRRGGFDSSAKGSAAAWMSRAGEKGKTKSLYGQGTNLGPEAGQKSITAGLTGGVPRLSIPKTVGRKRRPRGRRKSKGAGGQMSINAARTDEKEKVATGRDEGKSGERVSQCTGKVLEAGNQNKRRCTKSIGGYFTGSFYWFL